MDENEYREVYKAFNRDRCVFEKAINNRRCDCELKERKLIATREAVGCQSASAAALCTEFLNTMRQKARFSLKVITVDGPMPHNKELQVQAGGCLQLQGLVLDGYDEATTASNIHGIVTAALERYGSLEHFPYSEIVQGIVKYKSREKRKRR